MFEDARVTVNGENLRVSLDRFEQDGNWFSLSQGKTAKFLFDYFHLIFTKGDALLKSLKTNVESIDAILKNYYCANSAVECDNRYLTAMQWTSQGVTKYPPGGVNGTESVITGNTTAEVL